MEPKPDMPAGKGKRSRSRGFVQAGGLLSGRLRPVAEQRGFAETRLLTQWREIVGAATAAIAQPVSVSHGKGGLGATLTLLASGAHGPELQVQLPAIRERINAVYGYNAISRIRITQTAQSGFAEDAAPYRLQDQINVAPLANVEVMDSLAQIGDSTLRNALDQLGRRVFSRKSSQATGKR